MAILTSDDLTNIETGLAVRDYLGDRWVSVPVVLRVFDRDLGRTVEHHFDFRHVRSTSALAAPRFVGAALGLDILGSFTVGRQPFLVGRLTVAPGRGLDGLAMQDLPARTRVIALSRAADGGRLEHPPRGAPVSLPGTRPTCWVPTRSCCGSSVTSTRGRRGLGGVDRRSRADVSSSQGHLMFVLRSLQVRRTFTSDGYGRTGVRNAPFLSAGRTDRPLPPSRRPTWRINHQWTQT